MAGKKQGRIERLLMFELVLWDAVARVAAMNVATGRRMLADHHHFHEAWVASPNVSVTVLGWDEAPGWRARARKGGDIVSVVDPPPRPHKEGDTARINDLRMENQGK